MRTRWQALRWQSLVEILGSGDDEGEAVEDGGSVAVFAGEVVAAEPVDGGEEGAAAVEDGDEVVLVRGKRAELFVAGEGEGPTRGIIAEEAAKEAGEVGGDGVASAGGGVDQAGDVVVGEEDVIVP